jgi:hypothetical protein
MAEEKKEMSEMQQLIDILDSIKVNIFHTAKAIVFHAIRTSNPDEDIDVSLVRADKALVELQEQEGRRYHKRIQEMEKQD